MAKQETVTTTSINVGDMSLEQLVQVSQGIGHKIEALREQRAYLRDKIDERLAAGERTSNELREDKEEGGGKNDAAAPGAVLQVSRK
jgi:hypothetical protein